MASASGASALSLADLVAGSTLTAGNGVTYGQFSVKVKGGLSKSLADYQVVATSTGFAISGDISDESRGKRAGKGKIKLGYEVATTDPGGLLGGQLGVDPGNQQALVAALKTIFNGKKKLGTLEVSSLGTLLDQLDVSGLSGLRVKERIRLDSGFAGGSVSSGFSAVPEPGTFALVGLGLATVAALRRRKA